MTLSLGSKPESQKRKHPGKCCRAIRHYNFYKMLLRGFLFMAGGRKALPRPGVFTFCLGLFPIREAKIRNIYFGGGKNGPMK